jgi:hypothetical protein
VALQRHQQVLFLERHRQSEQLHKPRPVGPEEHDLRRLLLRFLLRVRGGAPFGFPTFKAAWKELGCSHILTVSRGSMRLHAAAACCGYGCVSDSSFGAPVATTRSRALPFPAPPQACPAGLAFDVYMQLLYLLPLDRWDAAAVAAAATEMATPQVEDAPPGPPAAAEAAAEAAAPADSGAAGAAQLAPQAEQLDDEALLWLHSVGEERVAAAAVYCLHCLFSAQPGKPTVRIRLGEQHQRKLIGERRRARASLFALQMHECHRRILNTAAAVHPREPLRNLPPLPADLADELARAELGDAAAILRHLLRSGALAPACAHAAAPAPAEREGAQQPLAPGAGVLSLTPGAGGLSLSPCARCAPCRSRRRQLTPAHASSRQLTPAHAAPPAGLWGEDAATLREMRFHLDSTLRGLGAAHVRTLCGRYQGHLAQLWAALGDGGGEAPPSVADLKVGDTLCQLIELEEGYVNMALAKGLSWKPAVEQAKAERRRVAAAAARAAAAGAGGGGGGAGPSRPAPRPAAPPAPPAPVAPAPEDDLSVDAHGLPAVAKRLMQRQAARKADMQRRARPWAKLMGLTMAVPPVPEGELDVEEDDMPAIPGMPSLRAHLAGPARAGGGGGNLEAGRALGGDEEDDDSQEGSGGEMNASESGDDEGGGGAAGGSQGGAKRRRVERAAASSQPAAARGGPAAGGGAPSQMHVSGAARLAARSAAAEHDDYD